MKPEDEVKQLSKLIRQFESVYKSTTDPSQRDRVEIELNKLKQYKKKLESFHSISADEKDEPELYDELERFPHLKKLVGKYSNKEDQSGYTDHEVYRLSLYMRCFEIQYMALLSENKLKLDFKYSLERDGFYHRFEQMRRRLQDYTEDITSTEKYAEQHEEDMRRRRFAKKRNVILDADRFFRSLAQFCESLTDDIAEEGLKCLNSQEKILFDKKLEGKKIIHGFTVEQALQEVNSFAREVASFLNVPQIEPQES